MKKNWFFILLLSIAALSLAGTAAYFSVFGISKLFLAAGWGIIILASSLEFAKLVTVSYVYRFWKSIKKAIRWFYIFAVCFIMLLTSIGIYGFLTSAYQKSANKMEIRDSQVKIAENKKTLFVNQLKRINTTIESDNTRITQLSNIRGLQERRIDTLYNRKQVSNARRTESSIAGADEQIKFLNSDITDKMKQANSVNDSIAYYDQKIVEYKSSDISNEVGPYKFVADLTGIPMNKVVNIVAILIILVFDPLAIALLIGVNQLTMIGKKPEDEDEKNEPIPILEKIKKIIHKEKKVDDIITDEVSSDTPEPPSSLVPIPVGEELKSDKPKTPDFIQQEIPFVEDEPVNDTVNDTVNDIVNDTVIEKKTLVGEDFLENPKENDEEYEEILEPLTFIDTDVLVYHEVFGKGKILDVYPNQRIKVEFESGNIKELNTDFANLQQIKKVKKDWFDKYAEDLKKNEINDLYVQEKIVDEKSVLDFTTKQVEYDEEVPYITLNVVQEPIPEPIPEPETIPEPIPEPETIPEPIPNKPLMTVKTEQKRNIIYSPTIGTVVDNPDDSIQSLTFGHNITKNDPETIQSRKIHFTKDRKGRVV